MEKDTDKNVEKDTDKNMSKIQEISQNKNNKGKKTISESKYMKIEELFNAMANLIFKLAVSHTVLPLLLRGQFFSGTCIPHLPS